MYLLFRLITWMVFITVVVAGACVVAVAVACWYMGKAVVALFEMAFS